MATSLSDMQTIARGTPAWDKKLAIRLLIAALICTPPALFLYMARFTENPDPFIYGQVAKEMLAGRRLYAETWQDKPPLAYVAYALPQVVLPRSYAAIAFFGGLCISLVTALYAYYWRRQPAAMISVALFLALFPTTHWNYIWPSTEVFSNVFVAGVLLIALTIHRDRQFSLAQCLVVGVLACLAFHVRQNAVACIAIALQAVATAKQPLGGKLRGAAAAICGALATWALVLAFVAWTGDVRMYFWTVFVYPRTFAAAGVFADVLQLWWHLWLSPSAAIIAFFSCLAAARRSERWFVVVLIAVGLLSAASPMRNHTHYWVCAFPYVALVIGMGMDRLFEAAAMVAWAVVAAMGLLLAPVVAIMLVLSSLYFERYDHYANLADAVDRAVPAGETLFVCGGAQMEAIQFASRLRAANTFEWAFQMRDPWMQMLPTPMDDIIAQYVAEPPDAIVTLGSFIARANAEPEPVDLTGDLRLLRALTRQHQYVITEEHGGVLIAIREAPN